MRSGAAARWALGVATACAAGCPSSSGPVKSANSDAADELGTSVAIGPDTIAAGAPAEDSGFPGADQDNSRISAGAAYLFR